MSAPMLELDFVRQHPVGGLRGIAFVLAGALGLGLVGVQLHDLGEQKAGLELRREQLARSAHPGKAVSSIVGLGERDTVKTVRELTTPWSQLLAELESASADTSGNIAVLSIEPDHAKHRVRVTAEARSLGLAIAYVQRLRKTQVLHFPMLDNHEIKKDDKDHPVRFQISADWSDAS